MQTLEQAVAENSEKLQPIFSEVGEDLAKQLLWLGFSHAALQARDGATPDQLLAEMVRLGTWRNPPCK